jgi:hypothetical protein
MAGGGVWIGAGLRTMNTKGKSALALSPATNESEEEKPVTAATAAQTEDSQAAPVPGAPPVEEPAPLLEEKQVVQTTPTPVPTPKLPTHEPWQYDSDMIVRVHEPEHATAAAHLTLLRRWGIEVDLSTFAEAPSEEISQYDLPAMVRQLDFRTLQTPDLTEALKLDLPMIVRFRRDAADLPAAAAMVRMQGELFSVADPERGLRTMERDQIESAIYEIAIFYHDPHSFAALGPGSSGESVKLLQEILIEGEFFDGEVDGKYGPGVSEAVRKFQQSYSLPATGRMSPFTAALAWSRRDHLRPRLYS